MQVPVHEPRSGPRLLMRNSVANDVQVPMLGTLGNPGPTSPISYRPGIKTTQSHRKGAKSPSFLQWDTGPHRPGLAYLCKHLGWGKIPPPPALSLAEWATTIQPERSDRRELGLDPPKCYFGKDLVIRWVSGLLSGR